MKQVILILVLATGMAACASGGSKTSEDSASDATGEGGTVERKKVCSYERSQGTGSRMERVCKWEEVGQ